MAPEHADSEKAFPPYYSDENDDSAILRLQPKTKHIGHMKSHRPRPSTVLLILIVALLVAGRFVECPMATLWRKHGSCDNNTLVNKQLNRCSKRTSSTIYAHQYDSLHKEGLSLPPILNDIQAVASGVAAMLEEAMVENGTPGIFLAAAIDPDGNRLLVDLTSTGTIYLRKSVKGDTSWTDPEIVPANLKPKLNSPLAAIPQPGTNGTSNVRLYYLDATNLVVELACNTCGPSAPCVWHRQTYFTSTSSGGLSVVWMGYADGIRVFIITSAGGLSILQWFQGSWRVYVTGLTVAPKIKPHDVWSQEQHRYNERELCRTIDADFKSTQADAATGSAYGTPDTFMRVYYIGSGVMEHFATPEGSWDTYWSRMWPSEVPDTPGGAVAGIAWASTEVRVYYMAGAVIHEIGLTEGRGWWSVGHLQ
ncbi:MAG: hypothetical protein Q9184_003400 [Pyrenodesmia sp. 2 TL-2023]